MSGHDATLNVMFFLLINIYCDYYRPQTKFAKIMFLNLPVIHSVHGGLDAGGESTSKGVGHTPPIGNYGIRSTSGRYVSYWNAFLLI